MGTRLLLCDCLGSQTVDATAIGGVASLDPSKVYTNLCGTQTEAAAKAIEAGDVMIACAQESAFFEMLAEELGVDAPGFVDIRDRAGWSDQGAKAGPKQAALAAEAALTLPAPKVVDVISEGTCLIVGAGEAVFAAAAQLCDTLAVTVLQTDTSDVPLDRRFDVVRGQVRNLNGALGQFEVRINGFAQLLPGGRGAFAFSDPKDGAVSELSLIHI